MAKGKKKVVGPSVNTKHDWYSASVDFDLAKLDDRAERHLNKLIELSRKKMEESLWTSMWPSSASEPEPPTRVLLPPPSAAWKKSYRRALAQAQRQRRAIATTVYLGD